VIITFHRCPFGVQTSRRGDEARAFLAHVLDARLHQLKPHVDGEEDRDQADETADEKIEDPDVLVVGRHEPAGEEPGFVVFVAVDGCVRHVAAPALVVSSCPFAADKARPVSLAIPS
jgi:hypothetical protein